MKRRAIVMAVGVLLLSGIGVAAPEPAPEKAPSIDDMIRAGGKAYERKDYPKALEAFQKVVAALQEKVGTSLAQCLPEPPKGWTASEVKVDTVGHSGGGQAMSVTHVSRAYTRTSDKRVVKASLTNMPARIAPIQQMIRARREMEKAAKANPMLADLMKAQQNQKTTFFEKDGWQFMITETVAPKKSAGLTGSTGGVMLQLDCEGGDAAGLREFLDLFDLKGIAKAAGVS